MSKLLLEIDSKTSKAERDIERLTASLNALNSAGEQVGLRFNSIITSLNNFQRNTSQAGNAAGDLAQNMGDVSRQAGAAGANLSEAANAAGNASGGMAGASKEAGILGKEVNAITTAATAAIGAIVAMTHAIANSALEHQNAAKIAGMTAKEFRDVAFAASMYGIEAEAVGDIFKDVKEKIGDFLTTGGGGMQDFADSLALSADEARDFAKEMINLSAQDVVQRMVSDMEKHGASIEQISFALEGMGSDLTKLIPLFTDGGKEAKRLAEALGNVSSPITDEDAKTFAKFTEQSKLFAESWESMAQKAFAPVAHYLGEIYEKSAKVIALYNQDSVTGNAAAIVKAKEKLESFQKIAIKLEKEIAAKTEGGIMADGFDLDRYALENARKEIQKYSAEIEKLEINHRKLSGTLLATDAGFNTKKKSGTTAESEGADAARKAKAKDLKELQQLYMTKKQLAEAEESATLLRLKTALEKGDLTQKQYDQGVINAAKKRAEAIEAIEKKETAGKVKEVDIRAQLAEREKEILLDSLSTDDQKLDDKYQKSLDNLSGNLEAEKLLLMKHEADKADLVAKGVATKIGAIDYQIAKEQEFFEQMQENTLYSAIFSQEKQAEYLESLIAMFEQKNEILAEQRDAEFEAIDLEAQAMLAAFIGTEEEKARIVDRFTQKRIESENKYRDAVKANAKTIANLDKNITKQRTAELQKYTSTAMDLNAAFFDDNKKVKAGLVIIDTAAGVMNAYASMDPYSATFAAAGILATGAMQLQSIKSASRDGGGSVASSDAGTMAPEQQEKEAPTMAVGVTDASGFSAASNEIRVSFDEDHDLGEFLNKIIKKAQITGR